MRRFLLVTMAILLTSSLGLGCGQPIFHIQVDGDPVETFSFDVMIVVDGGVIPETLEVSLNGSDISDRFSGGPNVFTATIEPGAPLRDWNFITAVAERDAGGFKFRWKHFRYLPPGKARAVRITSSRQLITGPLGHSKMGDWLLENDLARFVVQDVAQRELYSVGQYGGNLIDAELVGNEGKDNFLEVQPGLNIETVINAQTVEVVNDGQDGTAAVLRTCGPDDLLDFANPSSQVTDIGLGFPGLANDFDLEIEGCTTYTLEPNSDPADPQDFVKIDTEVFNNEPLNDLPDPLPLIVGDWLNPAGEVETLAHSLAAPGFTTPRANGIGPPVTTSIGALSFYGFDEAAGTDYSFVEAAKPNAATFAFISGVLVVLHQDNVLSTLIGAPPSFRVPRGGSRAFTRYFGVGDGSAVNAFHLEQRVNGTSVGTLEGCVTVGGSPVAGAKVTAGLGLLSFAPPTSASSTNIVGNFITDAGPCPNYSGPVRAGLIAVTAAKQGHLYPGGGLFPAGVLRGIAAGVTTTVDFDLTAAGRLQVAAIDESGLPIPARVTVVGHDPSPPLVRPGPSLPGFGGGELGIFDDVSDRLPFGVVAVGHTDASGQVEFDLEPGVDRYHVYVSRGTEYSAWRTPNPITVTPGEVYRRMAPGLGRLG
jgi:hypothetical protein